MGIEKIKSLGENMTRAALLAVLSLGCAYKNQGQTQVRADVLDSQRLTLDALTSIARDKTKADEFRVEAVNNLKEFKKNPIALKTLIDLATNDSSCAGLAAIKALGDEERDFDPDYCPDPIPEPEKKGEIVCAEENL